jgi:hypothetical protein
MNSFSKAHLKIFPDGKSNSLRKNKLTAIGYQLAAFGIVLNRYFHFQLADDCGGKNRRKALAGYIKSA